MQTSHYLPIEATAYNRAYSSRGAILQSPRGNDGAYGHLGHLILSMKFFYLLRLKKTPISWYTSYAVGELAFPSRGGDGLTHDDVNTLLAFLQLLVSIAALLKD